MEWLLNTLGKLAGMAAEHPVAATLGVAMAVWLMLLNLGRPAAPR